jgi:hypothetical protein
VRNSGQVKEHIHTAQQITVGTLSGQIHGDGRLPITQWRTAFAQCNYGVSTGGQALAKQSTDKPGRSADKTFHVAESP